MVCNHHWMETLFTDEKLIFNCETMKLLKIDSINMLTDTDKTTGIIIKILLVCSVVVVGIEMYILLKL